MSWASLFNSPADSGPAVGKQLSRSSGLPAPQVIRLDRRRGAAHSPRLMKTLLRGVLFVLLSCLLTAAIPEANASGDRFAAVAFSPSTGRWGYSNGFSTQSAAMARARAECGARDAIVKWTKNAWISLAVSDESPGGYGWAWGTTAGKARGGAVDACLRHNPDARVVVTVSAYR
jgi:hypothetical protein